MKQSLSRRFSVTIITVVAIIVMTFTMVLVWDTIKRLEADLHQRLVLASNLAELTLALPLWELNFAQVQDCATALAHDRDMVYVNIIDMYGKSLAMRQRADLALQPWEFFTTSPRFIAQSYAIRHAGSAVGTLQLAISRRGIKHEIQARMLWIALFMLCLMIAIVLTCIATTRRYILSPLFALVDLARAITDGATTTSPPSPLTLQQPQDEIGILAQVFERMAHEVYSREQRLQQEVRELSIEIDQVKKAHQVAEVTETDYFRRLQDEVHTLRTRNRRG
jgi:HAMP domain-containing protein